MKFEEVDDPSLRVPIYVGLQNLNIAASRTARTYDPLLRWLFQQSKSFPEFEVGGRDLFDQLCKFGRIVFLLDGLDEVPSAEQRALLAAMLPAAFGTGAALERCSLIVASRPVRLPDTVRNLFQENQRYHVQLLDRSQIENYVRGHFDVKERPGDADGLLNALRTSSPPVLQLLSRPFFLAMACVLAEHDEKFTLPSSDVELMEQSVRRLLMRRDLESPDVLMRLLSPLAYFQTAFSSLRERETLAVLDLHRERDAELAKSFPATHWRATDLLHMLATKTGLFFGDSISGYRFSNRVVAEYLVGSWVASDPTFLCQLLIEPVEGLVRAAFSQDGCFEPIEWYGFHAWRDEYRWPLYWMMAKKWRGGAACREQARRMVEWVLNHVQCPGDAFTRELLQKHLPKGWGGAKRWRPLKREDICDLDDVAQTMRHRAHEMLAAAGEGGLIGCEDLVERFWQVATARFHQGKEHVDLPRIVAIAPWLPTEVWGAFDSRTKAIAEGASRDWMRDLGFARVGTWRNIDVADCGEFQGESPVFFVPKTRCVEGSREWDEFLRSLPTGSPSKIDALVRWHPIDQMELFGACRDSRDDWQRERMGLPRDRSLSAKLSLPLAFHWFRGSYDHLVARFTFVSGEPPTPAQLQRTGVREGLTDACHRAYSQRQAGAIGDCLAIHMANPELMPLHNFLLPGWVEPVAEKPDAGRTTHAGEHRATQIKSTTSDTGLWIAAAFQFTKSFAAKCGTTACEDADASPVEALDTLYNHLCHHVPVAASAERASLRLWLCEALHCKGVHNIHRKTIGTNDSRVRAAALFADGSWVDNVPKKSKSIQKRLQVIASRLRELQPSAGDVAKMLCLNVRDPTSREAGKKLSKRR